MTIDRAIAARIDATRVACEFCEFNRGFDGPRGYKKSISLCNKSASHRVSLAAGVCPLPEPRFDASDLTQSPRIDPAALVAVPRRKLVRPKELKGIGLNRVLILIANGQSYLEAPLERLRRLRGIDFMCVNKPDDRIWPAEYWCMCDESQVEAYRNIWREYEGVVICGSGVSSNSRRTARLRMDRGQAGFQLDLTQTVPNGLSTTYVAMQVATWMRYRHVYIFGLDMVCPDGRPYKWGSNPRVGDNGRERKFATEAKSYQWAADHLPKEVLERFTICSSYNIWPFTEAFERLPHRSAVETIIERHRPQAAESPITLITPTGGRPEAFAMCEQYMQRQSHRGERQWIVVDDCEPATATTMGQEVIRPEPFWQPGQNTQSRSMQLALDLVRHDRVLIIEDDDWYGRDYLQELLRLFDDGSDVVGFGRSRYYNVKSRRYRDMGNTRWAAACQTGFRAFLSPELVRHLLVYKAFDIQFWRAATNKRLDLRQDQCVGIKGMPGRFGAASGHTPNDSYAFDRGWETLRAWIGAADAKWYERFYDEVATAAMASGTAATAPWEQKIVTV